MKGESDTKEPDDADGNSDSEPAGERPENKDTLDSTGKVLNQQPMWVKMISPEIIRQHGDNVGVAFEVLEDGKTAPQGWTKASGHNIWDLAKWVLASHKLPTPEGSTYAGVVSRESVRIALTYAALNGLEVCAPDIRNAYLQARSSCKDYIICGPEFVLENESKVALFHGALKEGHLQQVFHIFAHRKKYHNAVACR
jgi:hypothetical protein